MAISLKEKAACFIEPLLQPLQSCEDDHGVLAHLTPKTEAVEKPASNGQHIQPARLARLPNAIATACFQASGKWVVAPMDYEMRRFLCSPLICESPLQAGRHKAIRVEEHVQLSYGVKNPHYLPHRNMSMLNSVNFSHQKSDCLPLQGGATILAHEENEMTKTLKDVELSERLRELIENKFGDRGKFRLLREVSNIPEWKWKNFFYRRQEAGQDQIQFWVNAYPEDASWLLTGTYPPDRATFPFNAEPPIARDDSTIGDRLRWVVEEFAAPRGEALFSYLAERYGQGITAEDWQKVMLRKKEPTAQMVALVCSDRPMFAQWVLLGHAYTMSVDPTDKASIQRWNERKR